MAKLSRVRLDRFFQDSASLFKSAPKSRQWIRLIREALGMSKSDLAARLETIPARVVRIEKDEELGKLTMETLQKAAEALNCEFVYFLVPKVSLQETIEQQAEKLAQTIVSEVDQTMALEEQRTNLAARIDLVKSLAQDLIHKNDRRIWKTK
jgi:predicted DNA-binding mobile mystery protein A